MSSRTTTTLLLASLTILALQPAAAASRAPAHPTLRTIAEQSGNLRTGRYDEVERLCPAYQQTWPKQVRCFEFGRTPEGRPMLALVAAADGVLDAGVGSSCATADRVHAGRYPCRRVRRQRCRLVRVARDARWHRGVRCTRCNDVRVRAGAERRRPRALRALESAEPGRAGGDGLAHDRAELQSEPRLRQGRRTGNASGAATAERVGPDPVRRPARDRRRAVRARRRIQRCADVCWRHRLTTQHGRNARRAHAAHARRRLAAARLLSLVRPRRRSCLGLRHQCRVEALFDRVLGGAQPHRRARRDAFLEGLPDARAHHAQLDHRDDGDGRTRRPQMAASGADGGRARGSRRRHERRADVRKHAARADDRVPRLRIHSRAVGHLGRAADALQPEKAADLAHSARGRAASGGDRHGAAWRLHRACQLCADRRREIGDAWHRVPQA